MIAWIASLQMLDYLLTCIYLCPGHDRNGTPLFSEAYANNANCNDDGDSGDDDNMDTPCESFISPSSSFSNVCRVGVDIVLVYLLVLLYELYPSLFMQYLMFHLLLTYLSVAVRMIECQCVNIQPITSCNAVLKPPLCIWVDVFSKNG